LENEEISMYRLYGWVLAGGLVLGSASVANAQVSISVGNPYTGTGFSLGVPAVGYGAYSYGYPYGGAPIVGTTYSSGYAGYVAPATGYLTTGYYGAYPLATPYPYTYSSYGYGVLPYRAAPYGYGLGGWGRGRWGRFW